MTLYRDNILSIIALLAYLFNVMVSGNTVDKPWPESMGHIVSQPEPPERGLVIFPCLLHSTFFIRHRVGGLFRHNDHLTLVNLEGNLKLFQNANVIVLHFNMFRKETRDLSHSCIVEILSYL